MEALAALTVEESSEFPEIPVQERAAPSAEEAASLAGQAEAVSRAGRSLADAPGEAHKEHTPKKSPLQGSQILNTPSLQDPGKASKGILHNL